MSDDKNDQVKPREMTVVFPIRISATKILQVCLATKLTGPVNLRGFLNGYGGGLEPGETPLQAAIREFGEESGAMASNQDAMQCRGCLDIVRLLNDGASGSRARLHFFVLVSWQGEIRGSQEAGDPEWHDVDKLPLDRMLLQDGKFVPYLFGHTVISGQITLDGEVVKRSDIVFDPCAINWVS